MDKREFKSMYSNVCALLASVVLVAAIKPNFSDVVADHHQAQGEPQVTVGSFSSRGGGGTSPPFMSGSADGGASPTPPSSPNYQTCSSSTAYAGQLYLFSTLDGQISAIGRKGNLHWSVNTNPGPLISSSIQNLQFSNNDGHYRIVPMLDGNLFKWNGECLEGVPFNAESLLSASFKLSEDITVIGGKEKTTYGINAQTGKVRYTCSSFGCQVIGNDGDQVTDDEDLIVVERKQHTIRAVEQRTGIERWNFSVGQHDLSFLEGNFLYNSDIHMDNGNICGEGMQQEIAYDDPILQIQVSTGRVYAFSRSDPSELLWSHEFPSAIAQAWTLQDGEIELINLFDGTHIPAIASEHSTFLPPQVQPQPMMYLGTYKNQLYAQSSEQFQEELSFGSSAFAYARPENDELVGTYNRVLWQPYQSTAQFRTPSILHTQDRDLIDKGADGAEHAPKISYNDYPFDVGYYLFRSQTPAQYMISQRNPRIHLIEGATKMDDGNVFVASLWNWWKEILATSFLLSVVMQFFHSQCKKIARIRTDSSSKSLDEGDKVEEIDVAEEVQVNPLVPDSPTLVYTSRYLVDFDHQQCLGKGGFGIVFQAKNRVDENEYAVKRITLPNRSEAREKVLREARALAKLDHGGIVRYFNSWLEEPPLGWQEEKDNEIGLGSGVTTTVPTGLTIQSFSPDSKLLRDEERFHRQTSSDNLHAESKDKHSPVPGCHGDDNTTTDDTSGTNGFNIGQYEEESGSFSIIFQEELQDSVSNLPKESFGFEVPESFPNSDQSEDTDNTQSVPFQNYGDESFGFNADIEDNSASFQVVFEDSGCAEKGSDQTGESAGSGSHQTITKERSKKCNTPSSSRSKESEAKEIRKLEKKPIAKVYLYIQMQLCQKETLKDWLSKITLNRNRNRVLHMYDQIVQAMHYVHSLGLIHRDLKPSNIFFSTDSTIKIGDFGLVTAIDTQVLNVSTPTTTEKDNKMCGDQRHTSQVGTHLYMSPEQLEGKTYGSKVDIFSMGLIFFEMLFPFSTDMERIKVLSNAKKSALPKRFTDELPTETKFVKWLLSREPDERPDADEIMDSNLFANVFEDYAPPHPVTRKRYSSNSTTS
ncbi:eukaryotic translation initiation factor 2-alpha kinase 3-like [Anneissia japonica]|uniref:eukaryotic translation initiation factor 2-alpha kinase 3-like n=1 Tax=Anneissia japonica TaxID=1529436 RepID=UPI0014256D45|nr:eukaryotic translation initiation factor 2-alpha kinase 3-like [Anneissia japonica]